MCFSLCMCLFLFLSVSVRTERNTLIFRGGRGTVYCGGSIFLRGQLSRGKFSL